MIDRIAAIIPYEKSKNTGPPEIKKKINKNAIKGSNVFIYDSQDNIVNVPEEKLVVMQGIQGYIVAEKDGNLLICKKENEQQIKQFISDIKNVNN